MLCIDGLSVFFNFLNKAAMMITAATSPSQQKHYGCSRTITSRHVIENSEKSGRICLELCMVNNRVDNAEHWRMENSKNRYSH